jgi:hypothetical protein
MPTTCPLQTETRLAQLLSTGGNRYLRRDAEVVVGFRPAQTERTRWEVGGALPPDEVQRESRPAHPLEVSVGHRRGVVVRAQVQR